MVDWSARMIWLPGRYSRPRSSAWLWSTSTPQPGWSRRSPTGGWCWRHRSAQIEMAYTEDGRTLIKLTDLLHRGVVRPLRTPAVRPGA